jgi:hypothetical protein
MPATVPAAAATGILPTTGWLFLPQNPDKSQEKKAFLLTYLMD